jgi:hypothetical protein
LRLSAAWGYGAIAAATDSATGIFSSGEAFNYPTSESAQQAALAACLPTNECQVYAFSNAYASIARGPIMWAWAYAPTKQQAENMAMEKCVQQGETFCRIYKTGSSGFRVGYGRRV